MSDFRRKVLSARPDPEDRHRRRYGLECGHSVSRRYHGADKRWAVCGYCDAAQQVELSKYAQLELT